MPPLDHLRDRVVVDPDEARALFRRCEAAAETPLLDLPDIAAGVGAGRFSLKDETDRMGLGSFKALGAVHSIAGMAVDRARSAASATELGDSLKGEVFVCASAGNHGMSVAAGAALFGATSVVYVSETVSESFEDRLQAKGARVVRIGSSYEESMEAAAIAAQEHEWILLSDSSWPGYYDLPASVMEGYLISGAEVIETIPETPTHIFLQAGVGGFAAAISGLVRRVWGDGPRIVVVEPTVARCVTESALAGEPVTAPGPVSTMGRLDCKVASHLALARLCYDVDYFVTIDDTQAEHAVEALKECGVETTPSGAAGVAAALSAGTRLEVSEMSRVLAFATEGPERR